MSQVAKKRMLVYVMLSFFLSLKTNTLLSRSYAMRLCLMDILTLKSPEILIVAFIKINK